MVDDAHGSGVLGGGRGTAYQFGVHDRIDVQLGTLSKAVGVMGGYIAGQRAADRLADHSARGRSCSAPRQPPAVVAAINRRHRPDGERSVAHRATLVERALLEGGAAAARLRHRHLADAHHARHGRATRRRRRRCSAGCSRRGCWRSPSSSRPWRAARRASAPCRAPCTPGRTSTTRSPHSRRSADNCA